MGLRNRGEILKAEGRAQRIVEANLPKDARDKLKKHDAKPAGPIPRAPKR